MAKVQLTPEEIAAKKIRRSNGWTRFWAIVVALVLVGAATGFVGNKAQTARTEAEEALKEQQEAIQQASANTGVIGGVSGNGSVATGGGTAAVTDEAQAAVDAINAATAAAANATYDWARNCVVSNISVGDQTEAINNIIHRIDSNADLNSVVGGFLGQGQKSGTNQPGGDVASIFGNDQYPLKATSLQAADLQNLTVEGTKYTFSLPTADNPQKDGQTALSRLTNDFITEQEVSDGIANALGALSFLLSVKSGDVSFEDIQVTVELNDAGQLTSLSYSYFMNVKSLELSIATGTGSGTVEASYSNFVY